MIGAWGYQTELARKERRQNYTQGERKVGILGVRDCNAVDRREKGAAS